MYNQLPFHPNFWLSVSQPLSQNRIDPRPQLLANHKSTHKVDMAHQRVVFPSKTCLDEQLPTSLHVLIPDYHCVSFQILSPLLHSITRVFQHVWFGDKWRKWERIERLCDYGTWEFTKELVESLAPAHCKNWGIFLKILINKFWKLVKNTNFKNSSKMINCAIFLWNFIFFVRIPIEKPKIDLFFRFPPEIWKNSSKNSFSWRDPPGNYNSSKFCGFQWIFNISLWEIIIFTFFLP